MGLKLMIAEFDRVLVGNDTVLEMEEGARSMRVNHRGFCREFDLDHDATIELTDNCTLRVLSLGRRPQIEFDAPPGVKIILLFDDLTQQFKNMRRKAEGLAPAGSPRFHTL